MSPNEYGKEKKVFLAVLLAVGLGGTSVYGNCYGTHEDGGGCICINSLEGSVEVTSTHPFLLNGDWSEAGEIQEGDFLIDRQGNPLLVSSIERINKGVRVYNVSLGGSHTFFAAGILVHNKPPIPGG